MDRRTFLNNPDYIEYVRLLKVLHALAMGGEGDEEAIQDEMDRHWYRLNAEETARVRIMSAGLQMIEGKEIFRPVSAEERSQEWLGPKLQAAQDRQDWVAVLELLRNGPDFLQQDQLAYLRGLCYANLGHPDVALLFFEYAAKIAPQNDNYRMQVMDTLKSLDPCFAHDLAAG